MVTRDPTTPGRLIPTEGFPAAQLSGLTIYPGTYTIQIHATRSSPLFLSRGSETPTGLLSAPSGNPAVESALVRCARHGPTTNDAPTHKTDSVGGRPRRESELSVPRRWWNEGHTRAEGRRLARLGGWLGLSCAHSQSSTASLWRAR